MSRKTTVLVTGGSGLVGNGIKRMNRLHPQPNEVWVYLSRKDADLTNFSQAHAVLDKYRPTHVLHLAANVGGLFKNMAHPVEMWESNVAINNNVLRCAKEFNVNRLVSSLSTCIFPDNVTYPIHEGMLHDGAPHYSNETYAYAKRMVDVLCRSYRRQYGFNWVSVIPTNIYGPYDNYHLRDAHVIPALIHKFFIAQRENKPVVIFGTGSPLRQFIYSQDLAELMMWALRHYNEEDPIILSVDEKDEVSIADVVHLIAEAYQFKGQIIFDTTKADGQVKKTVGNRKMRQYLPYYSFTPLSKGILETVEWFTKNYESARK
ncbi:unnamed protein product [Phytomonas sp. EM1]|nr:unnamed protein product [Phytomonas sp. EM1]|eukprot:CCW62743.1 unnamed protein product [Phytomonas sp. isolate EM1]